MLSLVLAIVMLVGVVPFRSALASGNANEMNLKDKAITAISMKVEKNGSMQNVNDGDTIHEGDKVQVTMNFELASGVLSANGASVLVYETNVPMAEEISEKVFEMDGQRVGTYSVSKDGKIIIKIDDGSLNFVDKLDPGRGFVTFTGKAVAIDDGNINEINLGNTGKKFFIEPKKNLILSKSSKIVDANNIDYTVEIESNLGSQDEIKLTDVLKISDRKTGLSLYFGAEFKNFNIVKINENNDHSVVNIIPNVSDKKFDVVSP